MAVLQSLFCYTASWLRALVHALIKCLIAILPFELPTDASFQSLHHRFIHWMAKVNRDRTFMILLSIFLLIASLLAYAMLVAYLYEKPYLANREEYRGQWLQGRGHEFGYASPNQPHPPAGGVSMPAPGPSSGGFLARNHTNGQVPPGRAQQSRAASLPPFPSDGSIHNSSPFHRYSRSPSLSPSSSSSSSSSSPHRFEANASAHSPAASIHDYDVLGEDWFDQFSPRPDPETLNLRWVHSYRPISFRSLLRAGFVDEAGYLTPLGKKPDSLKRIGEMGIGFGYRRVVRLGPSWWDVCQGSLTPKPAAEGTEMIESSEEGSELDYRLEYVDEEEEEIEVDEEDVVESIEVDYY